MANGVNGITSLGSINGSNTEGGLDTNASVVSQAVEGAGSLHSIGLPGPISIRDVVERLGVNGSKDFDRSVLDRYDTKPFGFSRALDVVISSEGSNNVRLELFSQAGEHHVHIGVLDRSDVKGVRLSGVNATLSSGAPLPFWMHVTESGLLVIDKQFDQRPVHIELELSLTNGKAVYRDIIVNPASGEILSVSEARPLNAGLMFGEQLEKLAMTPEQHAQKVAVLLMR